MRWLPPLRLAAHIAAFEWRLQLRALDGASPDTAAHTLHQGSRVAVRHDATSHQDGHARAQVADIVDDVSGQDHHDALADLTQQVVEAVALFGVQTCRGFVDDHQPRLPEQCLCDAEALAHAA